MKVIEAIFPGYWSAPEWTFPAVLIGLILVPLVVWSWSRRKVRGWPALVGLFCKTLAIALLLCVLVEPMSREEVIEPQANLFVVLADNSRSLNARESKAGQSWTDEIRDTLKPKAAWLQKLEADFDVRKFAFDERTTEFDRLNQITGEGRRSDLYAAIADAEERFPNRPIAGILLLTDGVATDATGARGTNVATANDLAVPVFPVVFGATTAEPDVRVSKISASQTNFESAPVTVTAEIRAAGFSGKTLVVKLLDARGKIVEEQELQSPNDETPLSVRFRVRPENAGVEFYSVVAMGKSIEPHVDEPAGENSRVGDGLLSVIHGEATSQNNRRTVVVDRSGGPYRILYLSGRPNWEFKFLRRSIENDDEIDLVGLIRIAKREPKFSFRDADADSNPLFRGFGADEEQAEQYDEPVMLRLGTEDAEELRGGFPKSADELYRYHAVILDDVEADFFSPDQKKLLKDFVSLRGGGLLMLGGQESFGAGGYSKTPIGEVLPVYPDRPSRSRTTAGYRLGLTRDGWTESWTRLRTTEAEEERRLNSVPEFTTVNRLSSIKPGARVLIEAFSPDGDAIPALVTQPFGRGRTAAMLVGDLWTWHTRREDVDNDDFINAWRQTVRWLVADTPKRVSAAVQQSDTNQDDVAVRVIVRDEEFRLLDNVRVTANVVPPDGTPIELSGTPVADVSGEYLVSFLPRDSGAYRVTVTATGDDGSEVGTAKTGFAFEPDVHELRELKADTARLSSIAKASGGEVVSQDGLLNFVEHFSQRESLATNVTTTPLWHTWAVFFAAIGLLVAEWGLRRWKGLP